MNLLFCRHLLYDRFIANDALVARPPMRDLAACFSQARGEREDTGSAALVFVGHLDKAQGAV